MMAECTQGSAFSLRSHRQPSHLESSPDIPELGCLAKENSSEACLGTDSTPSLSRKTKNIYTAGATTPASLKSLSGLGQLGRLGGTSEGACVPEHSQAWLARQKTLWPSLRGREKVLENKSCSGLGGWG